MRKKAFTLIEVLVALSIFALAAVGLGAAYSNVLLSRMALKEKGVGEEDFARCRAAVLETANFADIETGGDVYLPEDRMARWKGKIEPTTVADLFWVTITVEIQATAGGPFGAPREQSQWILRPTWSVESDRTKLLADAKERLLKTRGYDEETGGGTSFISKPSTKNSQGNNNQNNNNKKPDNNNSGKDNNPKNNQKNKPDPTKPNGGKTPVIQ
jgi:prepilin-type N-terminal cleavage/methylation domain-containing protein